MMAAIAQPVADLLNKINLFILNPLIILLFAVALLIFLWGIFQFVRSGENMVKKDDGKKMIAWGLFGMFIMMSAYGLVRIILLTLGVRTNTGYIQF